jgi:shikimate dehydrogenase
MIKAAVLGSPIGHSLSPLLHKTAYDFLGLANDYQGIEVTEAGFSEFFKMESKSNWSGFSLTMPLKEISINFVDEVDPESKRINSINTIYPRDGMWFGRSTDLLGFRNIFSHLNFEKVAVIGAGGTARAALGALDNYVSSVDVLVRNSSRISSLEAAASNLKIKTQPMDSNLEAYDLIVSTTPVGANDSLARPVGKVSGMYFDVLYSPIESEFAKVWKAAGGESMNGLPLLVEQALYQIEIFAERKFDLDAMRNLLLSTGKTVLEK